MINLLKVNNKNLVIFFIQLIAVTLLFRKVSTLIIILFFVYSLFYYKNVFNNELKKYYWFCLVINIPILLEILFFWNNDSFYDGIKSLEKSLACLILPYIIIAYYKSVDLKTFLKRYSFLTITTLIICLFLFSFFESSYFEKYMNGIHLWQMGYQFALFFGIHAPALNMYVSFISIFLLSLLINLVVKKRVNKKTPILILLFLLSFIFLLIINTRIALVTFLINFIILFVTYNFNLKKKISIVLMSLLLLSFMTKVFVDKFPYTIEKYTTQIFNDLDKVGKLDEIQDPEIKVYSSLVTRLSIWKSSLELGNKNFLIGVGSSDAKNELTNYYKSTNQLFLAKYGFITHNQFLNYYIKYGIVGLLGCLIYLLYPFYIGFKTKNVIIICFAVNFFISNLTDDYLNKFDGLVYSSLFYSIFTCYYLNYKKKMNEKN